MLIYPAVGGSREWQRLEFQYATRRRGAQYNAPHGIPVYKTGDVVVWLLQTRLRGRNATQSCRDLPLIHRYLPLHSSVYRNVLMPLAPGSTGIEQRAYVRVHRKCPNRGNAGSNAVVVPAELPRRARHPTERQRRSGNRCRALFTQRVKRAARHHCAMLMAQPRTPRVSTRHNASVTDHESRDSERVAVVAYTRPTTRLSDTRHHDERSSARHVSILSERPVACRREVYMAHCTTAHQQ